MKLGRTTIMVERGDIARFHADAIVNAANTTLLGGAGVDGAIHRAAGLRLFCRCLTLGGCRTGQAKITPGYRLPAKYIIHTPGPVFHARRAERCDALLRSSYLSSLRLAEEHGIETIAFPSIATGGFHFPLDRAAKVAAGAFLEYFTSTPESCVSRATMVCFDQRTFAAYENAFAALGSEITNADPGNEDETNRQPDERSV